MNIQLHRFLPLTTAEGPGKRACIWVQGCPIHCKGCGVPWTWNPAKGTTTTVEVLWEQILESKQKHGIEGITFLGGEPFEQAQGLAVLGRRAQGIGLSVMTFSGYYKEQLERDKPLGWNDLLLVTDLFIDGPFEKEQLDESRPWLGSKNQRIHFLTSRYGSLKEKLHLVQDRLEVYINADGTVEANGMVGPGAWDRIFKGI